MPFIKGLPDWGNAGAEPAQSKKDAGWTAEEKPPASIFNWFFNRVYLALQELQGNAIHKDQKGVANGVAGLDAGGKVPGAQLPLNNTTTSTSTVQAATANAVKVAYDLASGKAGTAVANDTTNGLMSSANFNKLASIADNAEVNQNAFTNVKIGAVTVAADAKTDTLEFVAGSNITLTADATNDKITIAASGGTADATAITDAGNYYTSANAEGALQEIGQTLNAMRGNLITSANNILGA